MTLYKKLITRALFGIYFFITIPTLCFALEFDIRYASARNALMAKDLPLAQSRFESVIAADPTAEKAHFMLALIVLARTYEEPDINRIMDRYGFTEFGRDLFNWHSETPMRSEDLTGDENFNEIAEIVDSVILQRLQVARMHLERIQSRAFEITLREEYFGSAGYGQVFVADKTDVDILLCGILATQAMLRWAISSHSMDLKWESLRGLFDGSRPVSLETVLTENPNFFKLLNIPSRQQARSDLRNAIERYVGISQDLRQTSRESESRLFYLTTSELDDETAFRSWLLDLYAATEGPVRINIDVDARPSPFQTIDLRPLFSELDLRATTPEVQGNLFSLNQGFDATLGGLFPLAGFSDAEGVLADEGLLLVRPQALHAPHLANYTLPWTTSQGSVWYLSSTRSVNAGIPRGRTPSWLRTSAQGPALIHWNTTYPQNEYDFSGHLIFSQNQAGRTRTFTWEGSKAFSQRIGSGVTELEWAWSMYQPKDSGVILDNFRIEPMTHYFIDTPEQTTRAEIRGMTPDGSILVGAIWEGDVSYPAYETGTGQFVKLGYSSGQQYNGSYRFATASDISTDGKLIVGRSRNWQGYTVPTVWYLDRDYHTEIPISSYQGGMALGVGGLNNEIVVGRLWNGLTWEAAVWKRNYLDLGGWSQIDNYLDLWGWSQIDSYQHPDAWEAEWHAAWLYSISSDGSTAVGWVEIGDNLDSETPSILSKPLIWNRDGGFAELPFPSDLNRVETAYISKNGQYIVGDFGEFVEDSWHRGVIVWRRSGATWTYMILRAPEWLTHVGVTPLHRITEDGMRIYTTGSTVDADEVTTFYSIVWTHGKGWQRLEDVHAEDLAVAGISEIKSARVNPNASVLALTDITDTKVHLSYLPIPDAGSVTQQIDANWMHADWLGIFAQRREYIFSDGFGWLRMWTDPMGGFHLYHLATGRWAWSKTEIFPHVYQLTSPIGWTRW